MRGDNRVVLIFTVESVFVFKRYFGVVIYIHWGRRVLTLSQGTHVLVSNELPVAGGGGGFKKCVGSPLSDASGG